MRKLVGSDFARLCKNRLVLLAIVCFFGFSLTLMLYDTTDCGGSILCVFTPFRTALVCAFASAVLTAFTCGERLDLRTVNHLLTVGYTKTQIYFSNLLIGQALTFTLSLPFLAGMGAITLAAPVKQTVLWFYFLLTVVCELSLSALFAMLSMLSGRRMVAVILCLAVCGAMLLSVFNIETILQQPEVVTEYGKTDPIPILDENGKIVAFSQGLSGESEEVPNPHYVGGAKRKLCEAVLHSLPMTMVFDISTANAVYAELEEQDVVDSFDMTFTAAVKRYSSYFLTALCFAAVMTVIGVYFFKRKDLE